MTNAKLDLTRRPAALLLDAGDTLIFLEADALADATAALGERVDPRAIERAIHPAKQRYQQHLVQGRSHEDGWSVLVGHMLTSAGLSEARAAELLPDLRKAHDAFYFWRRVPEGTAEALQRALDGGIRLGIISNSEGRLLSVLQRVGIAHYFEHVVDSQLEGVQKPDAAIFRIALERFGLPAERTIYAGDIPNVDVTGSRGVGMHGVLIDAWGDHAGRDDITRFVSVVELVDALLALPPQ